MRTGAGALKPYHRGFHPQRRRRATELGIELRAGTERLEDDFFRRLRPRPGELPLEPLEHGQLR